jgi:hypothetical protein
MFNRRLSLQIDFWLEREERAGGWLRLFRRAMRRYHERQIGL